jgi:hypothetical protein
MDLPGKATRLYKQRSSVHASSGSEVGGNFDPPQLP